jgi:hypothetical protein
VRIFAENNIGIDSATFGAANSCARRHRRPTPMGPPPQDPSNGAKGSSLLRPGRVRIFVLRSLWAGATAAQSEETSMTTHKDLKTIIRERQSKTGESYTAARLHVMRARAEILGLPGTSTTVDQKQRVEAIVLKVNRNSARVRIPSEDVQVTFRSGDATAVAPGHLVMLVVEKRWTWRGDAYASGKMEDPRIDVAKLGLTPLPLHDFDLRNLRSNSEPYRSPDPYAPLWRKLTAKPRASYDMDPIAWGAFPDDDDFDENPTCVAAELAEVGDVDGARELLMDISCSGIFAASMRTHTSATSNSTYRRNARLFTTRSGSASANSRCHPPTTACCCGAASTTGRSSGASTATACASGVSGALPRH